MLGGAGAIATPIIAGPAFLEPNLQGAFVVWQSHLRGPVRTEKPTVVTVTGRTSETLEYGSGRDKPIVSILPSSQMISE